MKNRGTKIIPEFASKGDEGTKILVNSCSRKPERIGVKMNSRWWQEGV